MRARRNDDILDGPRARGHRPEGEIVTITGVREGPSTIGRPLRADRDLIAAVDQTLDVLHGKWKPHVMFALARGVRRPSRLLECLPGGSKKMMTDTLRALERDGLVQRRLFAEVPVRVEYSLTPLGWTMSEPLIALAEWGETHRLEVTAARAQSASGSAVDGRGSRSAAA
jgi:DNA-binding HxlR family transcriptional regulator